MPADIVSDVPDLARQQETILLMDDYGQLQSLIINMQTQSASRASIIADAQSSMATMQANTLAYYTAAGWPAPAVLTLADKQAKYAALSAAPAVSTMTVSSTAVPEGGI